MVAPALGRAPADSLRILPSARHLTRAVAAVAWLVLLAPPAAAVSSGDFAFVMTGASDEESRATIEVHTSRIVETDPEGGRLIALPLPPPFELDEFTPAGRAADGSFAVENNSTGLPHAVFRWTARAPAVGTEIEDVTLRASRIVPPHDTVTVVWLGYDIDTLDVRVEVPETHEVFAAAGRLTRQEHDVPDGTRVWVSHQYEEAVLSFIVRPASRTDDPAFSDPPWAGTGFVIVVGIALASGGAWVLGKRLERGHGPGP